MRRKKISDRESCFEKEPIGYVAWHEFVHEKNKTHYQIKCKKCGLFHIWKRRNKSEIRKTTKG